MLAWRWSIVKTASTERFQSGFSNHILHLKDAIGLDFQLFQSSLDLEIFHGYDEWVDSNLQVYISGILAIWQSGNQYIPSHTMLAMQVPIGCLTLIND